MLLKSESEFFSNSNRRLNFERLRKRPGSYEYGSS